MGRERPPPSASCWGWPIRTRARPRSWACHPTTQGLEIRRRVGYVPERPTLYEWMTVDEIGWFTAGFYGNGFLPEYARLTAGFGLPGKKKISHLSKGTRAKVLLSLALANQPELLILDEPTSGLDAMVRREFLESMVDRAAAGKTVFLSSHQIAEVERVADIVAILRKGKLILVERLDELKSQIRKLTVTMKDGAMDLPQLPRRDSQQPAQAAAMATDRPGPKRRATRRAKEPRKRPGRWRSFPQTWRKSSSPTCNRKTAARQSATCTDHAKEGIPPA